MNKFPLQACLETKWHPTARLVAPFIAVGPAPMLGLGNAAGQTRRLHQTSRTPPRTSTWRRSRVSLACSALDPLHTPAHRRGYSTPDPSTSTPEPTIHSVFEPQTSTWQYLVADPATQTAVIIDPVLDYNNATRTVSTHTADALLALVRTRGYTISHILETHAHADHLTAAFYLQRQLAKVQHAKPPVGIGKRIGQVQQLFGERYGVASDEYDGVFDLLLEDDAVFPVGRLQGEVMHLPGHTPDHVGYRIGG